jgi:hypothetical protein
MWDFYLGWSEGAFRERYINVAQIVLAKNGVSRRATAMTQTFVVSCRFKKNERFQQSKSVTANGNS